MSVKYYNSKCLNFLVSTTPAPTPALLKVNPGKNCTKLFYKPFQCFLWKKKGLLNMPLFFPGVLLITFLVSFLYGNIFQLHYNLTKRTRWFISKHGFRMGVKNCLAIVCDTLAIFLINQKSYPVYLSLTCSQSIKHTTGPLGNGDQPHQLVEEGGAAALTTVFFPQFSKHPHLLINNP